MIVLVEIVILIISMIITLVFYRRHKKFSEPINKIDGPPPLPLVGNLHQVFVTTPSKQLIKTMRLNKNK